MFAMPTYAVRRPDLPDVRWSAPSRRRTATSATRRPRPSSCTAPPTSAASSRCCSPARVRLRLHGAHRRRGDQQRRAGVPQAEERNAATTLAIMGALAIRCSSASPCSRCTCKAHAQPSGNPSVISQIAATVFGSHAVLFYLYQAATAGILILAANTAFNGFPVLSSILAHHSYLPRQLHNRGDKLVFSNGIILLGGFAIALIIGFDANIDKLIQLYIIGVFTSFTLSQAGMVRHWNRLTPATPRRTARQDAAVSGSSTCSAPSPPRSCWWSCSTPRSSHGAWLAILAMIVIFVDDEGDPPSLRPSREELDVGRPTEKPMLPARNHAIVLVSRLHLPTLRAHRLRQGHPAQLASTAVTIAGRRGGNRPAARAVGSRGIDIPLVVLDSPYREVTRR